MAFVSTNSDFLFLNTATRSGRLFLPSTTGNEGRILTFKDVAGTFAQSTLTLSTLGRSQSFEDGTNTRVFSNAFGSYSLIASSTIWYSIGGAQINQGIYSTLEARNLSTLVVNTSSILTFSTILTDTSTPSTNTLFQRSTLLYFQSNVLGGAKVGVPLFLSNAAFTPRSISALRLWLDAADVATVQFFGDSVSQWNDKSGCNYNAFQTTPINRPRYTVGNALVFDGISSFMQITDPEIRPTNVYAVLKSNSITFSGNSFRHFFRKGTAGTTLEWFLRERYNTATPSYFYQAITANGSTQYGLASVTGTTPDTGFILDKRFLIEMIFSFGANMAMFTNGTDVTATTSILPGQNNTTSNLFLGSAPPPDAVGATFLDGEMNEVLMFNAALTTTQRQQVEGYLAWKWNFVTDLPANHPYKNVPP